MRLVTFKIAYGNVSQTVVRVTTMNSEKYNWLYVHTHTHTHTRVYIYIYIYTHISVLPHNNLFYEVEYLCRS